MKRGNVKKGNVKIKTEKGRRIKITFCISHCHPDEFIFLKALLHRVSNLADVLQVLKCCSPILSNPGKVERGSPPLTKALQI